MNKEQLAPWIEKLTKAAGKDRTTIVGEMCKENGLKVGDAWKLLKEAGFDPKGAPPEGVAANPATGTAPAGGEAPPDGGGENQPPVPGAGEGEAKEGGEQPGGTPPATTGDSNPPPPASFPSLPAGKKRVKCEALKNQKITVGNGVIVQVDGDGILEVDADDAARLLTIPGYEEP
jgi:hypothetical protein